MRSERYEQEQTKKQNFRYTMIAVFCALVVLAGAVYTVRANPQWIAKWDGRTLDINNENENRRTEDLQTTPIKTQDVSKPVPTVDSKDDKGTGTARQNTAGGAVMVQPVKGEISKKFSPEAPVYSATLDQYTVHNGVDIDAELSAQVCAAAEGTVTKVYNDDKLGLTIEITHADGVITKYSNLSTDKMVGEGDVVTKGQVISGIGDTALFESIEPTHLHFEVWKDGAPVDPEKYFK